MAEGAQSWGTRDNRPLLLYSVTGDSDANCVMKFHGHPVTPTY